MFSFKRPHWLLPSMLVQKNLQQGCTGVGMCPSLSQSSPPPSIKLLQFIFQHSSPTAAAPERPFTHASLTFPSISKWQRWVFKSQQQREKGKTSARQGVWGRWKHGRNRKMRALMAEGDTEKLGDEAKRRSRGLLFAKCNLSQAVWSESSATCSVTRGDESSNYNN